MDQTSPQTTANSQRLWSFTKPAITKNTTHIRANTFGFYAINGNSVVDFKKHSKKEDVCEFLESIRDKNPGKRIIIIIDNFKSHHAKMTIAKAKALDEILVFLPPYSLDLNPLEFLWKSIKWIISAIFVVSVEHLKTTIRKAFIRRSRSLSYAEKWINTFLDDEVQKYIILGT